MGLGPRGEAWSGALSCARRPRPRRALRREGGPPLPQRNRYASGEPTRSRLSGGLAGRVRSSMDPRDERPWGERLAEESATSVGDERSTRRLIMDALTVVRERLGDIGRQGI